MSAPTLTPALIDRLATAAAAHDADTATFEAALERALDVTLAEQAEGRVLADLRALTEARDRAEAAWRSLLTTATQMGIPQRRVAEAAGVTPAWVGRVARAERAARHA